MDTWVSSELGKVKGGEEEERPLSYTVARNKLALYQPLHRWPLGLWDSLFYPLVTVEFFSHLTSFPAELLARFTGKWRVVGCPVK